MIERDILIANNRDQSRYRVVTGAETLGELQNDIARNENVYKMVGQTWVKTDRPIDISGLTFTEGITKTQLLSRDSALPTNVQFKGQTTNNLVMLLTNTNKQIRSGAGMDRKEAYRLVKELNLQNVILEGEGQNYTRVKTAVLESWINSAQGGSHTDAITEAREELGAMGKDKAEVEVNTPDNEKKEVRVAPHADLVELLYMGIKYLGKTRHLEARDAAVLTDMLTELTHTLEETPKISASDIDDMLKDICY